MQAVLEQEGVVFGQKIWWGEFAEVPAGGVLLARTRGPAMRYEKENFPRVEFPGEYAFGDAAIECVADESGILSFFVELADEKFAVVGSGTGLKKLGDIVRAEKIFFVDARVEHAIDQQGLEAEKVLLGAES